MLSTRTLFRHIGDAVCTTDWAQRLRIGRSLLAAVIYAGCLTIMSGAALLGLANPVAVQAAAAYVAVGLIVFYLLLRSGWNRRLADPAMTFSQILFATTAIMLYYAVMAPIRSAMLLVLSQTFAFGMFSLTPVQARRLTGCAIAGFGVTSASLAAWRPDVYDPRLEIINFVMVAAVLLAIMTLSSQFAELRARLRRQRTDLRSALARLEMLIRRDELTGLVNRRHMLEVMADERRRRTIDSRPMSLCAIDLDHFKRINDTFGHAAGDAVLKRFAEVVTACLRSIDVAARWGGEEFLLLLPATDTAAAVSLLERLRDALADPATWGEHPEWRVTFSAGVTPWRAAEAPDAAIERADQAAYRAKATGRDRWCVA